MLKLRATTSSVSQLNPNHSKVVKRSRMQRKLKQLLHQWLCMHLAGSRKQSLTTPRAPRLLKWKRVGRMMMKRRKSRPINRQKTNQVNTLKINNKTSKERESQGQKIKMLQKQLKSLPSRYLSQLRRTKVMKKRSKLLLQRRVTMLRMEQQLQRNKRRGKRQRKVSSSQSIVLLIPRKTAKVGIPSILASCLAKAIRRKE